MVKKIGLALLVGGCVMTSGCAFRWHVHGRPRDVRVVDCRRDREPRYLPGPGGRVVVVNPPGRPSDTRSERTGPKIVNNHPKVRVIVQDKSKEKGNSGRGSGRIDRKEKEKRNSGRGSGRDDRGEKDDDKAEKEKREKKEKAPKKK